MNTICTICARAGSINVKNKNIRKIFNYPLILYTINTALKSKLFDHVVVSTDSQKIINLCTKYGLTVFFKRPKKLSGSKVNKIDVIKDALIRSEDYYNKKFDFICDLDVSSPLRTVDDIKKCFNKFKINNFSNIFSVIPSKKNPYFNIIQKKKNSYLPVAKLKNIVFSRQEAPIVYDMNASIYIWKRRTLMYSKTVFNKNTGIYLMDERSIDIDSINDLEIVKFLIETNKKWQIKS